MNKQSLTGTVGQSPAANGGWPLVNPEVKCGRSRELIAIKFTHWALREGVVLLSVCD